MTLFLALFMVFTIGMIGVSLFLVWWMGRISHIAITSQFQAAEFILEQHTAPPVWGRPQNPVTRLLKGTNPLTWHTTSRDRDSRVKARIMGRLDELIAFFETCPFFRDEESREELLTQLDEEREIWREKSVDELIGHR